jgi:hypothetical protein
VVAAGPTAATAIAAIAAPVVIPATVVVIPVVFLRFLVVGRVDRNLR